MPIDYKDTSTQVSQREVFARNLLARLYRGYVEARIRRELKDSQRILDVGCGEGILLENLSRQYPDKTLAGVDLSPENVRICRELGLDVTLSDASDLKLPAGSFDACVMMSVLEHVEDPGAALREARRVLAPGGRLIVVEYGTDRGNPWVPHPISYETWEALAQRNGFARTVRLATRPSRFLGQIYSALSLAPAHPPAGV